MKHFETHPEFVEGCFGCKLTTVGVNSASLKRQNAGKGVFGEKTVREGVKEMYELKRARGEEDPIPANKVAAKFAPKKGIFR